MQTTTQHLHADFSAANCVEYGGTHVHQMTVEMMEMIHQQMQKDVWMQMQTTTMQMQRYKVQTSTVTQRVITVHVMTYQMQKDVSMQTTTQHLKQTLVQRTVLSTAEQHVRKQ